MRQAILKTIRSQNLYETIRSLELVHERLFDKNEIKNIIANYYKRSKL